MENSHKPTNENFEKTNPTLRTMSGLLAKEMISQEILEAMEEKNCDHPNNEKIIENKERDSSAEQ